MRFALLLALACLCPVATRAGLPRPVFRLNAALTNGVTFGAPAPQITTNAFGGLRSFRFQDGAYLTAQSTLTNRTVALVVAPRGEQRYNAGVFGRRGSIAKSIRGWAKWGDANWDAGRESFFAGGKAYVDGECRYDAASGKVRGNVSFADNRAHVFVAVAPEGVVYAPAVGANRDIPTDRAFWNGDIAEVLVFDRALDDAQIKRLSDALLERWRLYPRARDVTFRTFFQGQRNAALRSAIAAKSANAFEVRACVDGKAIAPVLVAAQPGETPFAAPLPTDLSLGRHPYELRIVRLSDGYVLHDERGELTVRPPLQRDSWKFFDWGGSKQPPDDFLKMIGIDVASVYVHDDDPARQARLKDAEGRVRELTDAGFWVNLRYENGGMWQRVGYDDAAIARDTRRNLAPYEGLASWLMTLVNTERYGTRVLEVATNASCFCDAAKAALGDAVDFNFQGHPLQLPFENRNAVRAGLKGLRGVVRHDNAALETLVWFYQRGVPAYRMTRLTAQEVRRVNPEGIVWTEPLAGEAQGEGVDMLADWIYAYGANVRLGEQCFQYGRVRALKRPAKFMPTISPTLFYSGLNVEGTGALDPTQAKKDHPTASAEELMLYTWIALGATRHDALSIWNLGDWYYGKHDAEAPARYGAFIRDVFRPVAERLRGLENERAPLAVLHPLMPTAAAGGARFSAWHAHRQQRIVLSESLGVPFDYLFDAEITAEVLRQYPVVYVPWAHCLYEEQVKALASASAEGTQIVADAPGAWLGEHCARFTCLKEVSYRNPKDMLAVRPLAAWAHSVRDTLRGHCHAWSDRDGAVDGSYTFVKREKGRHLVLVVNAAATNAVITTHVKGGRSITERYRPLEARLFECPFR